MQTKEVWKSSYQSFMAWMCFLSFFSSETVAYLKNYAIGETPTISVASALEEAKKILKEIQMRNFTRYEEDADRELM